MPDKQFLEEYPLYRRFIHGSLNRWTNLRSVPKPAIHMYCFNCRSDQTFNMQNDYHDTADYAPATYAVGAVVLAKYICSACATMQRIFLLQFGLLKQKGKNEEGKEVEHDLVYVNKVGQTPAWDISMDKELEEILGDRAQYYKRGLIAESQSYGIAAHAYFRRITEDIIDELLSSVSELMNGEERQKYEVALTSVSKTRVTQEKIDLVKDLLPVSLRPDGINPLGVLHSELSKGLHEGTDEECLESAENIRKVLIFLVNKVSRAKAANKEFTDGMRKLLDKKVKPEMA